MTEYHAVESDVGATITTTLIGADITGATIVAHLAPYWSDDAPLSLSADVVDGVAGTVRLTLADVPPGEYALEWQVTFGGGATVLTWPSESPDLLRVRRQVA